MFDVEGRRKDGRAWQVGLGFAQAGFVLVVAGRATAGAFERDGCVDMSCRREYHLHEGEGTDMRNPVRSETDAFQIAIGCAALIAVALALGSLFDPLVGVALVVGAVAGAFVWELSTKDPERRRPLQEAVSEARMRQPTSGPRVLVVANRTLHGEELRAEMHRRAVTGAELHVVAPILCSRAHYIASDVDAELEEARSRLATALAWAEAEGVAVTGRVGDANAALGAIEDELRRYGADEVIISTYRPAGRTGSRQASSSGCATNSTSPLPTRRPRGVRAALRVRGQNLPTADDL